MRKFALIAVLALSSANFAVAGPLDRIRERRESRVETRHHEPVSVVVDKSGKPALLLRDGTLAPITSKDGKLSATIPAKEKGVKVHQSGKQPDIQLKN
jgi:hypothetical protein